MDDTVDRARLALSQRPTAPESPAPEPQLQTEPPHKSRVVRWLVALALAVAGIFAFEQFQKYESTDNANRGGGAPPQTIRDAAIVSGDMPLYINALGAVTPLATVTVRTQIAGQLQQIAFKEGQMVNQGDFLAQIDDRPYRATLAQNEAQLAKDTELYNQAQSDLQRYQTLAKQDSIATQQVADQEFLVKQDHAAMASDQAQIDSAKLNITYCHIVSPVTGRIGLRQIDQGNYVQPTDANGLVVVTELEPISVVFSVPEDNLPQIFARLKAGATLPVVVFDRANVSQLATGSLDAVDSQIDTTTGTVKIRAIFDNKDDILFPQQFVNARLLVDTMKGAVIAPNAAVQQGSKGPFVYVVNDDDTVSVRQVKAGPVDGERTTILSGLKVGDQVVIDGVDRLRDGAKVSVRNNPTPQAGADSGGGASREAHGHGQGGGQHAHRQGQNQSDAASAPATTQDPQTQSPSGQGSPNQARSDPAH
jgi:membrane fusion protein, multidrug efflux system